MLAIEVPRATRKQRPVFLTTNPFAGHTYRRLNDGDRPLPDDEVKRMLAEQVETRNQSGVRGWFHAHYPLLMTLIPKRRHKEFAQGVIERGTEAQSAGTISDCSTSAEG